MVASWALAATSEDITGHELFSSPFRSWELTASLVTPRPGHRKRLAQQSPMCPVLGNSMALHLGVLVECWESNPDSSLSLVFQVQLINNILILPPNMF